MSMGDAGYQSAAPAEGPMAGYDPMLGKKKKKGVMDTVKKLKSEGYKPISQKNKAHEMEEKDKGAK